MAFLKLEYVAKEKILNLSKLEDYKTIKSSKFLTPFYNAKQIIRVKIIFILFMAGKDESTMHTLYSNCIKSEFVIIKKMKMN